ncbi:MAG: hypothetical protein ACYTFW_00510 [Planctomycetota bacterium]|jgi:sugar (pentulose or hexulose) kinase
MKVIDFLDEFSEALKEQLESDELRWGDTWRQRYKEGQEARIWEHIQTYFDQYRNAQVPIPWLKIAGLAMIAWIRENHPEIFPK